MRTCAYISGVDAKVSEALARWQVPTCPEALHTYPESNVVGFSRPVTPAQASGDLPQRFEPNSFGVRDVLGLHALTNIDP